MVKAPKPLEFRGLLECEEGDLNPRPGGLLRETKPETKGDEPRTEENGADMSSAEDIFSGRESSGFEDCRWSP